MNEGKPIEEGRSLEGKFTKGNKLQKRKKPISLEELETALTDEASKRGITLVRHAIQQAYKDNTILKHIIDKFIPNISVATSDIKPIQIIIERYYQSKEDKQGTITNSIDVTIPLAKSEGSDTYKL